MSAMGRVPCSPMHTPHAQLGRRATWCSSLHVSHVTDREPAVTGGGERGITAGHGSRHGARPSAMLMWDGGDAVGGD